MRVPISPMTPGDYVFLPFTGALLVLLLVLVLRWAHRQPPPEPTGRPVVGTHGVLVPVTTVRDPEQARRMIALLRSCGISATTSGPAGDELLLVWPHDAEVARDTLIRSSPKRR